MQNLTIDAARLWDTLMETAAFGACAGGGLNRLTLSEEDKAVRHWFQKAAEAAGCRVGVDKMGNMFARRPGLRGDLPPIAFGSHLDTQPMGGKFDGVLGVLAGLEVLRTLERTGYVTQAPLELINWTNEEGSRFAPAVLASGVFAGIFSIEEAFAKRDRDGVTFEDALEAIGFKGPEKAGGHKLSGYFELHIEQGPVLEAEDKAIGIVTGVQAGRWFDVTFTGQAGHTGATPMRLRQNALIAAAKLILAAQEIAGDHGPDAVGTVGQLDVTPNSRNVIPGHVFATVDLRHPQDETLEAMEAALHVRIAAIAAETGIEVTTAKVWDAAAVHFAPDLVACVASGAKQAGFSAREITSGASHDAASIARVAPAAMIFVPCLGGVSHNVAEYSSPDQCASGAQVLLNAILAYDDILAGAR